MQEGTLKGENGTRAARYLSKASKKRGRKETSKTLTSSYEAKSCLSLLLIKIEMGNSWGMGKYYY